MQRYTLSKCGLGCEEFGNEQPLLNKLDHSRYKLDLKLPKCSRCLRIGHSSSSCHAPRRVINIKKIWVSKGTNVPNRVYMANEFGPKVAWVPKSQISSL